MENWSRYIPMANLIGNGRLIPNMASSSRLQRLAPMVRSMLCRTEVIWTPVTAHRSMQLFFINSPLAGAGFFGDRFLKQWCIPSPTAAPPLLHPTSGTGMALKPSCSLRCTRDWAVARSAGVAIWEYPQGSPYVWLADGLRSTVAFKFDPAAGFSEIYRFSDRKDRLSSPPVALDNVIAVVGTADGS